MRSTVFVVISVLAHAACVAAIAMAPTRTVAPEGEKVEVEIGEPAQTPGVEEAKPEVTESKPEAIQEPAQKPIQPVIKRTKTVATTQPAQPKSKAQKAPTIAATPTEEPAIEEVTETLEKPVRVQETAPGGVEADDTPIAEESPAAAETEASSEDLNQASATEAPTPAPAPVATSTQEQPTGELGHGGATKEGAVSVTELKQLPGNKGPAYPTKARLEKRQGNMELVYRVTKDGHVTDIQVAQSTGSPDLDAEAVRAVAKFKFVPGQEGWARHPITFNLKGVATALPSRLRSKGAQAD